MIRPTVNEMLTVGRGQLPDKATAAGNREKTMRSVLVATAGMMLASVTQADAKQRVVMPGPGAGYPAPRQGMAPPPVAQPPGTWQPAPWQRGGYPAQPGTWNGARPPVGHVGGSRWGSKVGGRWWGGANAPGGWAAYRRPYRGFALPGYWVAPRFYINDWQTYGLTQPAYGYNWVRYYDDAVLVDGRGSVYDMRPGIDWDRYDGDYYASDDRVYADGGYDGRGYDTRYERRDNGVGGAVAGAVVGGVAGNLIAGRGNRLGGTLIGAGVGAAAGYAINKAEDRRGNRRYRDDRAYDVPVAPAYAPPPPAYAPPPPPPPPPVGYVDQGRSWRSADGVTTVTTSAGGSGYFQGGYYYPGATTTTVVVQTAPVVTTTTTEIYEDRVTYTRRPAVHTKTRRVWRPVPKCACR